MRHIKVKNEVEKVRGAIGLYIVFKTKTRRVVRVNTRLSCRKYT